MSELYVEFVCVQTSMHALHVCSTECAQEEEQQLQLEVVRGALQALSEHRHPLRQEAHRSAAREIPVVQHGRQSPVPQHGHQSPVVQHCRQSNSQAPGMPLELTDSPVKAGIYKPVVVDHQTFMSRLQENIQQPQHAQQVHHVQQQRNLSSPPYQNWLVDDQVQPNQQQIYQNWLVDYQAQSPQPIDFCSPLYENWLVA